MKKRYILYIAVAIVCVVAIILGVYYQVFMDKPEKVAATNEVKTSTTEKKVDDPEELKEEFYELFDNEFKAQENDTSIIKKLELVEDGIDYQQEDPIFARYVFTDEKEGKYSMDINLPIFNVQGSVPAKFNEATQTIFANKVNDIFASNTNQYTVYNLDFVGYLNDNILSLVIKSTLKEGSNPQRLIVQTYNYNVETGEEVKLNDILEEQEYDLKEVNSKIEAQIKEANRQAEAVAEAMALAGQNVYERDVNNAMYVTDNVKYFFVGENGQIYILYPYGNSEFTAEIDIIKL